MNELSELDQLIESDILEALGEKQDTSSSEDDILIEDAEDEITIEDAENEILIEDFNESPDDKKLPEPEIETEENTEIKEVSNQENQNTISEVSTNDLASLLSQLLNNKTIEITIKIKD